MIDHKVFEDFPVLETTRLVLREIHFTDAAAVFDDFTDMQVLKFLGMEALKQYDEAEAIIHKWRNQFDTCQGIRWAVTVKPDDTLAGTIGYRKIFAQEQAAEVGYYLSPDHWRRGIMEEALQAVLAFGFSAMALHYIFAEVYPANNASIGLLKKYGFHIAADVLPAAFERSPYRLVYGMHSTLA